MTEDELRAFADSFTKGLFMPSIVSEVIASAKTRAGLILLAIGLVVGLLV